MANKFHNFAICVNRTYTDTRYLSDAEKLEAAALFIAAFFIETDHWGVIDAKTVGVYGVNLSQEIREGYNLGVAMLRSQGLGKEAVCHAVRWVRCDRLPKDSE